MRIRALSVFEGIVYHCVAVDTANPCRPTLEVDALLRPGDADAGPLLVSVADWATMVGPDAAAACLPELERKGRVEDRMGVKHLVFRTWEPVTPEP